MAYCDAGSGDTGNPDIRESTMTSDSAQASIRGFGLSALLLCAALILPAAAQAQSSELFPRPPEIEAAVNFWLKVYTEVDTRGGYLHDARDLSVIYQAVPYDRRALDNARNRIRDDLNILGGGKRTGLTQSQQEILALFPATVSDQTLRNAASNVRFQLGQSDRFLAGLRRSGAYREHIRRVIEEKGLPPELGILPHVESSFNPAAVSSASAAGMWQFGRATGQRFMRIDHIVDERMDSYLATYAAMSLLEYNYSVLGTWPLALTAYNHGVGGMSRAVRETGATDIEKIIAHYRGRLFGFASRNFYPQFVAVLQIENDLERYFGDVAMDPAPAFREVRIDGFVDAQVLADALGLSLRQLSADNPALRPPVWEGNKRIPRGFPIKVRAGQAPAGDLLALVPNDLKFSVQTPDVDYLVERGDSLSRIAQRFDTSVARLVALNQLPNRHRIRIGQRLLLPQDSLAAAGGAPPVNGVYGVSRGDTVSRIAARFGVTESALLGANGIGNPDLIYPGQELRIPGLAPEQPQVAAVTEPASAARNSASPRLTRNESAPEPESESDAASLARNDSIQSNQPIPLDELTVTSEPMLPPAAVLPDDQELDAPVTVEERQAVAIDPVADVAQSNRMLSEELAADPSNYSVDSNNSIEVQASETLGHYAEWLGIRAWDIRRLNNLAFSDPVIIGERLRLDFSRVNSAEFERARREFHSGLQREFFGNFHIQGVVSHRVQRNENISSLASDRYSTPIWLLRQYNPGLDLNRLQIGQEIVFPRLRPVQ